MFKYIYWVKKKTCFGCFRIEEIRDNNNEIGLKEGGVIEMSTTVLFHIRDARSLRFCIYLPSSNAVSKSQPSFLLVSISSCKWFNSSLDNGGQIGASFNAVSTALAGYKPNAWHKASRVVSASAMTSGGWWFAFFFVILAANQNRRTHWANVVCKVAIERISLKQLVILFGFIWKLWLKRRQ